MQLPDSPVRSKKVTYSITGMPLQLGFGCLDGHRGLVPLAWCCQVRERRDSQCLANGCWQALVFPYRYGILSSALNTLSSHNTMSERTQIRYCAPKSALHMCCQLKGVAAEARRPPAHPAPTKAKPRPAARAARVATVAGCNTPSPARA